jgi:hypothetical protein
MRSSISKAKIALLFVVLLMFIYVKWSRDRRVEQLEQARERARQELKAVEQRDKRAREIIQRKLEQGKKWDSRFSDYSFSEEPDKSKEQSDRPGKITGFVFPYSRDFSGVPVMITGEDDRIYSGITDSRGQYTIAAPPGDYRLHISHYGHRTYQQYITIESGRTIMLNQIRLEKY